MRSAWSRRVAFAAAIVAAPLTLASCASDCDVACGKLQFCGQLPDISLNDCVDRCNERKPDNGDLTRVCSDCLHGSSCNTIRQGGCAVDCGPVVDDNPAGVGGSGGEGAGGSGGEVGGGGSGGVAGGGGG